VDSAGFVADIDTAAAGIAVVVAGSADTAAAAADMAVVGIAGTLSGNQTLACSLEYMNDRIYINA